MNLIKVWNSLPFNKRKQLASLYKIKDYGTTEVQLEFELQTKLPKDMLVEEVKPIEEPTEEVGFPPEGTGKEPVIEEVKEVKSKKKKAKK